MKFEDRIMYQKSEIGESIIDNFLISKNIIPYKSILKKSHPFDRLCASDDKKEIFIAEIKSVSKRNKFDDTGMSINHYNDYKYIENKYNIEVFIFFVDEKIKKIYGNFLKKLEKEIKFNDNTHRNKYPSVEIDKNGYAVGGRIIYFPLKNMINISDLSCEQITMLKDKSNYGYKENPRS